MDAVTRITLPPHLIEKIQLLLAEDIDLPKDLRAELSQAVKLRDDEASPILDSARDETASVPTIEEDLLLRASRWAQGAGAAALSRHNLLPSEYSHVSLFAGTQVYIPLERTEFLKSTVNLEKPNPYLPSYLSPQQSLFSGYRALSKQISTALNVLFSIAGSGAAVYMAAITGAGYRRETGVLLGLLAAVVVGISEGVLLWIFVYRVKESRARSVKEWIGSASEGPKEAVEAIESPSEAERGDTVDESGVESGKPGETVIPEKSAKREIRLRRRAIGTET